MKFSILATLILLGMVLTIDAIPQRRRGGGGGRRNGGGRRGDSSEEEGGRCGGPGGPGGRDGLKGPFEACEDDVSPDDLECGDDQKAMVFPNAACEDLSVGDSFPSKREIRDDNPCVESEEGDEVTLSGCYLCAEGDRRDKTVANLDSAIDLTIDTTCEEGRRGRDLVPSKDGTCNA